MHKTARGVNNNWFRAMEEEDHENFIIVCIVH